MEETILIEEKIMLGISKADGKNNNDNHWPTIAIDECETKNGIAANGWYDLLSIVETYSLIGQIVQNRRQRTKNLVVERCLGANFGS